MVTVDWPVAEGIHAVSTVRCGGISLGAYGSLNLAMHVGDSAQSVSQNRNILRQKWLLMDLITRKAPNELSLLDLCPLNSQGILWQSD